MKETPHQRWRQRKILAFAVIITLVSLPVLAAEATQPTSATPDLRASMARVVSTQILTVTPGARAARTPIRAEKPAFVNEPVGAAARGAQGTEPANRSGQFFKTGPGIAVLAVFAAGVSYALYSSQHDRVHSPGKQ